MAEGFVAGWVAAGPQEDGMGRGRRCAPFLLNPKLIGDCI